MTNLNIDDLETPGEWLRRMLSERKSSQVKLSGYLGCDKAQVNRWIKGTETIPEHWLDDISSYLKLDLDDYEVAAQTNKIHTKTERLLAAIKASPLISTRFPNIAYLVAQTLFDSIVVCDARNLALPLKVRLYHIALYLSDAFYAIRCVDRLGKDDAAYLITESDGNRHIRFPMNILIGSLIEMPARYPQSQEVAEFSAHLIHNLEIIADERPTENLEKDLGRQHAIHMLTRLGDDHHQELLQRKLVLGDVFTRRMIMFGDLLKKKDERSVQSTILAIDNDERFKHAVITFEAVHYGDVDPAAGFPKSISELRSMDLTVMRIISAAIKDRNEHILDFNLKKLMVILEEVGVAPFINNLPELRTLMQRVANEMKANKLREQFIERVCLIERNHER